MNAAQLLRFHAIVRAYRAGVPITKLSTIGDYAGMCFSWFIFEPRKKPVGTVPLRWISWKEACRKFPQTDADAPPMAKEQLGLFEAVA